MPRWELRAAWCATWCLLAPRLGAQSELSVDAGVAHVLYEGYLPSGVATLSPSISVTWPRATLDVRGTVSRFTSGNIAAQGTLAGSIFTRPLGRLRGELAGLVGGSTHQTVGSTGSIIAQARVHWLDPRGGRGLWLGGGVGQNRDPLVARGILLASGGGWLRRGPLSLSATLRPTKFDEGEYLESEVLARLRYARVELSAGGGARSGARIGERNAWGEAEGVLWLHRHIGLVAGVASFPSDPTRGLIGGRSAAVALRLSTRAPPTLGDAARLRAPLLPVPQFELRTIRAELRLIRIRAPTARSVELMADFTEWSPVALTRAADGAWELAYRVPAGAHTLNVRFDGGPWRVPSGVAEMSDDFGSTVGVMAVP